MGATTKIGGLLIQRDVGQGLVVRTGDGDLLRIVLDKAKRGRARLRFIGPPSVRILREEIIPDRRGAGA